MSAVVVAVSSNPTHSMRKPNRPSIRIVVDLGIQDDAHCGEKIQHRSRVARDPSQPNLRQVHLVHAELLDELHESGFDLAPGEIGENITTRGIDLLSLPRGTLLTIGGDAIIEITGLRNPCRQLNGIAPGLMAATLESDAEGRLIRKAGIMAIVRRAGEITAGDSIEVELPDGEPCHLEPV
ncbi:MAG: MOSC domain-containing protein [bacterium]|nr:MOSC domain-containing protein [bacterium]